MRIRAEQDLLPRHRPAIEATGTPGFDWAGLVALTVHPLKVAIVEALLWLGEPLSAAELTEMGEGDYNIDNVIYHAGKLTTLGVLEFTETQRDREARGRFYSSRMARVA